MRRMRSQLQLVINMSKKNPTTGVERHARQVQQTKQSSDGGISDMLPSMTKRRVMIISILVAIAIVLLWWRSRGGDDNGGAENGDDEDGGSGGGLSLEGSDETEIEVDDVNDDDPLAQDKKAEATMKKEGFATTTVGD